MPRLALSAPSRLARRLVSTTTTTTTTATPAAQPLLRSTCRQCRRRTFLPPTASRRLFSSSAPAAAAAAAAATTATPFRPSAARFAQPPQSPSLSAYAPQSALQPAALTEAQYHVLADEYLDRLLVRLEDMQDAREDVDVEYASGVLTLAFSGGARTRTYVINKQPPNKQIWLSSPVSGPKRYDWVLEASGSEETGAVDGAGAGGQWIYLKDGSALNELLRTEIGLDLDAEWEEA